MTAVPVPDLSTPPAPPLTELIAREASRRGRMRLVRWLIAVGLPLLVLIGWLALRPGPVPLPARFREQVVTQGDLVREVHATGNVDAVTTVQVGAEISGRIDTVLVDYNSRVKTGQVLARFDRTALVAQLAQAQGTLAAAQAALEQARTTSTRTARDRDRADTLHAAGFMTDADHDLAVAAARLADQAVTQAEAQLAAQQANYTTARTNLDHTVITAPTDGVVITRNIDPGQTVASVFQTPVLFTVAADLRKMQLVAAVDEADIGEVKQGQSATFTVDAYPDRVFEGVVTSVRNSPVVVEEVVTYGTVIAVANRDLALKPGMTATVRIHTASARNVLLVPNAALRFTPPGQRADSGTGIWVLDGTGTRRIPVRAGITDGELTAIDGAIPVGGKVLTGLTPLGRKAYGIGG
jgi:HlyD family secretion protein